jgi:hypothetical protein
MNCMDNEINVYENIQLRHEFKANADMMTAHQNDGIKS